MQATSGKDQGCGNAVIRTAVCSLQRSWISRDRRGTPSLSRAASSGLPGSSISIWIVTQPWPSRVAAFSASTHFQIRTRASPSHHLSRLTRFAQKNKVGTRKMEGFERATDAGAAISPAVSHDKQFGCEGLAQSCGIISKPPMMSFHFE